MLETRIIGNKIAVARKKLNISQLKLAQQLFISPQAVGKWERGESMPDIITFNRMAIILGVDLNYFSENFKSTSDESNIVRSAIDKADVTSVENVKQKPTWDMSMLNLVDSDFSGLKNLNEKFSSSNLQKCKFIGSDLSGILLRNNNWNKCDFTNSSIKNSHIQNSNLENNQFNNCNLNATEFSGSNVKNCDFTGTDFSNAKFKSSGFEKNNISNAIWNNTSFKGTYLGGITFEGNIENCSFEHCRFRNVKFLNVSMKNTFLKNNYKAKQIEFINCKADKITYAFLKNNLANLSGITLSEE